MGNRAKDLLRKVQKAYPSGTLNIARTLIIIIIIIIIIRRKMIGGSSQLPTVLSEPYSTI